MIVTTTAEAVRIDRRVVLRRLRAVERALDALREDWAPVAGVGIVSVFTDRLAVDVSHMLEDDGAPEGAWLSVVGVYRALEELHGDLTAMAKARRGSSFG